jgi:hypothetical protein
MPLITDEISTVPELSWSEVSWAASLDPPTRWAWPTTKIEMM